MLIKEVFFSKSLKPSHESCMCTKQRTYVTLQAPALMKCDFFYDWKPPHILSCHRYPVGSLLSFRWRALVSSGHALQGQTCQDLATYNIKHSFSQRKPGRFPKLPDRFFLDTPLCSTDRSFLRPGRFIFLLLFDSVFQRQEATKIKQEKNSLM